MQEDFFTRREHVEFAKRVAEEKDRQNHRIAQLEEGLNALHALTISVEKLAANMESMLREMDRQGQRLETLEGRDGERWRSVVSHLVTIAVGIACGELFRNMGGW